MTDGSHVVVVVHSVGPDQKEQVVGSVHSDSIEDRLDGLLGKAAEAGITDAASKIESLKSEHAAEVGVSTEQAREHAGEDIKDSLEEAISHAESERQSEASKDGEAGKDGEGSKDDGADGGHDDDGDDGGH